MMRLLEVLLVVALCGVCTVSCGKLPESRMESVSSESKPLSRSESLEVAERLREADEKRDQPVLSDLEDEAIMVAAAKEVIDHDENIPEDKREEALIHAVKAAKEDLERAGTTNEEFVEKVEREAATLEAEEESANREESDREGDSAEEVSEVKKRRKRGFYGYGYGFGFPYYGGFGFNRCLYGHSYPWCRLGLFSRYFYTHPYYYSRFYLG